MKSAGACTIVGRVYILALMYPVADKSSHHTRKSLAGWLYLCILAGLLYSGLAAADDTQETAADTGMAAAEVGASSDTPAVVGTETEATTASVASEQTPELTQEPVTAETGDAPVSARSPEDILGDALQEMSTASTTEDNHDDKSVDISQLKPPATADELFVYEYGPTRSGDTLTEIAYSVHTDERIDFQQLVWAIFLNNPHAFQNDNINGLKRGVILQIPGNAEILAIEPQLARQQVAHHNQQWRAQFADNRELQQTRALLQEQQQEKEALQKKLEELEHKAQMLLEENRIKDQQLQTIRDKLSEAKP